MTRRAADLMVDCLINQGADRLFCVPGESYLALLDALHESNRIETIVCRHEGGAGMMAVADAKMTGRPGLVAVSRGPGATNASIAIHLAEQDAVPLVALIGQVARFERGRGAFQEVDYAQMFGGIAKAVFEVTSADQLPEVIARSYHLAMSGTPGPVIISLPEDMLKDATEAEALPAQKVGRLAPSDADIDAVVALLEKAERPLIIAGGGLERPEGRAGLARLAKTHHIPVALTFKHQEIFDNRSELYAGHLGFKIPYYHVKLLKEADLILALGTRLGDVPTQGYQLPNAPLPQQPLIHVWPDHDVLGRVFTTDVALACDPGRFAEVLADRASTVSEARKEWVTRTRAGASKITDVTAAPVEDGLDFGVVARALADQAPSDTIVVTDAGNFSSWVHCAWPWDGTQTAIGAVGGAMGLAVPGAVAASLREPTRTVLAFVGDGGAMMTGNELATAVAAGAKVKIIVSDNGTYGTIRLHQERDHPNRISGTTLANPDFAPWAQSFGAVGITVDRDSDVAAAVADFLAVNGPALLHVKASAEAISAFTTITAMHERMKAAQ